MRHYTLSFQRRPIIEYVLRTVLSQAEYYGRRGKAEQSSTLSLILQNAGARGEGSQELRYCRLQVLYAMASGRVI